VHRGKLLRGIRSSGRGVLKKKREGNPGLGKDTCASRGEGLGTPAPRSYIYFPTRSGREEKRKEGL